MIRRLADHDWWGQVVGPHGSGKSTLLATLTSHLEAAGRRVVHFKLQRDGAGMQIPRSEVASWDESTQVVVDGYEQLGLWGRARLRNRARRQQAGLLISAHSLQRFPLVYESSVDAELARQLTRRLLPRGDNVIQDTDINSCLARNQGNLRETFFDLYDLYEERCRP